MKRGDIVRFKWGHQSGRWEVLRTDHPMWPEAIRVRCVVAPRGARHSWTVGAVGWVKAQMVLATLAGQTLVSAAEARLRDAYEARILGIVGTALREMKVGLEAERWVMSELRAALAASLESEK